MFNQDESMSRLGATAVENLFIQEYLPAARGDYVKVYLYALYLSSHPREGLCAEEIAQELAMPVSDVEGALRYWERRHLMVRQSDSPVAYQLRSPLQLLLSGDRGMEADDAFVAFSEDVYTLFGDRRKVRPSEIAQAYEWVQDLGLRQETVLMLLTHCMSTRGVQFSFKLAEADAVRMREAGVESAADAEVFFAHSKKVQDGVRAVLRRLGKRRAASQDELALYTKWLDEWKYTPDAILDACAETTKGEPTFAYLDGILGGIRSRAAARGASAASREDMQRQRATDQEEMSAVRAFAQALGQRSSSLVAATFQRLSAAYPQELMLLAAEQAQQAGRGLDGVEQYLELFQKRGLHTRAEAERYIGEIREANRALYEVFSALGLSGKPTSADRALYRKWRAWSYDEELLLLAAEQARKADSKLPYMDKILEAWHAAGVTSAEQVSARKASRAPAGRAAPGARKVAAQQYTQREYSDEELDALAFDVMEEARRQNG